MGQWLVIDLESTTEEGGWPLEEMEIIEIGATLVSASGLEHGHFQRFIRPQRRPLLTDFCRQLTHINQADIDSAQSFPLVWQLFERWMSTHGPDISGWCSWGDYDRRHLEQSWINHDITSRLIHSPHINLKQAFANARQLARPVGLKTALQLSGFQFQGQQHRALEDARNTARLLPLILPIQGT